MNDSFRERAENLDARQRKDVGKRLARYDAGFSIRISALFRRIQQGPVKRVQ